MGRHPAALQQAETARQLDPLSPIIQTWVGLRYYFARRYEDAIGEYRNALELDRDFAPAHWHLGWAYQETGQFEAGVAEARLALASDEDNLLYPASLGQAYARAGRTREARAILARLVQASARRHVSAYHFALIHIALGDVASGLNWLERAHEEQSPWIGYVRVDPSLDPVRSQPRFARPLRQAHWSPDGDHRPPRRQVVIFRSAKGARRPHRWAAPRHLPVPMISIPMPSPPERVCPVVSRWSARRLCR